MLSLVAFVSGGIVGLGVLLARVSHNKVLRLFCVGYIELFQGTPLLMQLFLFFFGVALFGIEVSPWITAWLALIYFALCLPLSWYSKRLEGRLNVSRWHHRRAQEL